MVIDNKIDDIIFELNGNLPEGYDHQAYFSYLTTGYYECIQFGEEVLWDSENYGEQKNLKKFVKKQYNKYVNTLKSVRFTDVKDKRRTYEAYDAVDYIIDEFNGRKGFDFDELDEDVKKEIVSSCVKIIQECT
jgi:hypothetical protein